LCNQKRRQISKKLERKKNKYHRIKKMSKEMKTTKRVFKSKGKEKNLFMKRAITFDSCSSIESELPAKD